VGDRFAPQLGYLPDTYNPDDEPEQYVVEGGIDPGEIDRIEEFVVAELVDDETERAFAHAYWTQVARTRWNPNYRDDSPPCGRCGNDDTSYLWRVREEWVCIKCITKDELHDYQRNEHVRIALAGGASLEEAEAQADEIMAMRDKIVAEHGMPVERSGGE
jgi:hypothetical protein